MGWLTTLGTTSQENVMQPKSHASEEPYTYSPILLHIHSLRSLSFYLKIFFHSTTLSYSMMFFHPMTLVYPTILYSRIGEETSTEHFRDAARDTSSLTRLSLGLGWVKRDRLRRYSGFLVQTMCCGSAQQRYSVEQSK